MVANWKGFEGEQTQYAWRLLESFWNRQVNRAAKRKGVAFSYAAASDEEGWTETADCILNGTKGTVEDGL